MRRSMAVGAVLTVCAGAWAEAPLPNAVWLTYARNEPTHVTVSWVTERPEASAVRYGADEEIGRASCRERV